VPFAVVAVIAISGTIYALIKDGPIPVRTLIYGAFWMGGLVSFLASYLAFGFYVYVVILTWRDNALSWQDRYGYWTFLLKRYWILFAVFIFGNYFMFFHFMPGHGLSVQSWLWTVLIVLPVFVIFVVGIFVMLSVVFRWMRRGKNGEDKVLE